MNKRNLFEELKQGIEEMRRYDQGEIDLVMHTYDEPDVQAIRQRSGLSQAKFAALIGVSVRTLQSWEKGQRQPAGPARALLRIVDKKPDALAILND
jgi:putative transcriptional regulator